jgi:tetratricopeptide (TPR) repeat protein
LNRIDRAEEQVQAALKLAPGDFTADLALAVLLLKRNDEAALSQAGELLTQMGDGLLFIAGMGESPSRQQWMDYTLIRGIYRALTGELAEARQDIDLVLRLDPNNEAAKEALEALGE